MNDLHDFGITGRLAYSISAFFNERQFKVRVGDTCSNPDEQEMDVSLGSILFVTGLWTNRREEIILARLRIGHYILLTVIF